MLVLNDNISISTLIFCSACLVLHSPAHNVAALEWVRNLGATQVPTIESFEKCEGRLGGRQSEANNAG